MKVDKNNLWQARAEPTSSALHMQGHPPTVCVKD